MTIGAAIRQTEVLTTPAAALRYASGSGVRGKAEVVFAHRQGRTALASLFQHDPLRVLFPTPPLGELTSAVLVTTSGGLVGGDEIAVRIAAGEGTAVLVSPQAAEKVYRSAGADCRIDMLLEAGPDAWLEWLPQETIVFNGARLRRRTVIEAAPGARVLAGEMLALGRAAMGERLHTGLLRDAWEVRCNGRLRWADALHIEGDMAGVLAHPAGLGGAAACATAVYVGDDAGARLEAARALLEEAGDEVRSAATVVNGVLVARWIAAEGAAMRRAYGGFWAGFRREVAGLPARLPRFWYI
ncbi:MAG: urease accessory protein UreD [Rhodospirillales bacterium]|nr:urease accessory protein UreD [Rhodospirillales bacterium]